MQTTRLTSIPISYPTRLGSSFWTKSLSSSWFNDSLGVGKKVSKSRRKKPILLWFIPHIYIYLYIHTYYLLFNHTHTAIILYHKVMNKTWKKNHGPPELSTVFPTLWYNAICQQAFTTDFMHTGHPVPLMLYMGFWIPNM